jgi:transcriptional regulator with XRE-family HTH domain
MGTEGLSQRDLAKKLGISQGHLSKVLRGRFQRQNSRVLRALAEFANTPVLTAPTGPALESEALRAMRQAAGGSKQAMHFIVEMMHLLSELRRAT